MDVLRNEPSRQGRSERILIIELLLDIRRMVITQNSGVGYAIQALKQEFLEWSEKQNNE